DMVRGVDVSHSSCKIGAQVRGYDPAHHFSRRELQRLSLSSQLGLVAAAQAIDACRLDTAGYPDGSVAVILGASMGSICSAENFFNRMFEGGLPDPLAIPVSMDLAVASNISIRWGFRGPLLTLDAACASATHAVGYAFNLIRFGMVEAAITGGAESPFAPF